MDPVLQKPGYGGQDPVLVIGAPPEYQAVLNVIRGEIHTAVKGKYKFIQLFAQSRAQPPAGDRRPGRRRVPVLCYPQGTSRKSKSDLNRNTAGKLMASYDSEVLTQVAVDEDWSALRFKPVDEIKTMKRKTATSGKSQERIAGRPD